MSYPWCVEQTNSSSVLNNQTPGSLAFARDMLLDVPHIVAFLALQNVWQLKINERLVHANAKHIPHDFHPGQQIYVHNFNPYSKLD